MYSVEKAIRLAVDFRHNAGAGGFDTVAFQRALQQNLLAGKELFVYSDHPAVAADQKGLNNLPLHDARGVGPGGFERDADRDPIALSHAFGASGVHKRARCRIKASLASPGATK